MKYLILSFFTTVVSFSLYSQEEVVSIVPVNVEGKIMYREVLEQEGAADSLYLRSISWLNSEFSNPWDVSRVRNREDGKIVGIARLPLSGKDLEGNQIDQGLVEYTFTIESKENRYRYTFTDFLHKRTSRFPVERWLDKEDPQYKPEVEDFLRQVDEYIKLKIESLKEGMKPKEKVVDEW